MVFLVWMRIVPLPGCKVIPESSDDALECVVSAASAADVAPVLEAALHHHRQRLAALEACVPFDPSEWDDRRDPRGTVRAAAAAVAKSGGVKFVSLGPLPR